LQKILRGFSRIHHSIGHLVSPLLLFNIAPVASLAQKILVFIFTKTALTIWAKNEPTHLPRRAGGDC
jgi:hypothetical protein